MGCIQHCVFRHKSQELIISLLFLLISSFTHDRDMVEGRVIPKLLQAVQTRREESLVIERSLIGSRPPRCERKCFTCGHCEAIQVPIVPQFNALQKRRSRHFYEAFSRDEDSGTKPGIYFWGDQNMVGVQGR